MKNLIVTLAAMTLLAMAATANEIRGTITDREGASVAGATVRSEAARAESDSGGRFTIQTGTRRVTLTVNAAGYYETKIETRAPGELKIVLDRIVPLRESLLVTADNAKGASTPRSFTDFTRTDAQRSYWAQDVPMLLMGTPGLYAYSDNGNGIGYSYLKIRGFAQNRVSVLINGIPHNDPEGGDVFWIDYADMQSRIESFQVQRGVGMTLAGASNLGGFINLETARPGLDRTFAFSAGAGSFDSRRYSAAFDSGLLSGQYALSARLSKITSDGYRDLSWTDMWSYFLAAERLGQKSVQRLHIYGGPEETHLAYLGVTRDYLSDKISGDPGADRKANPLTYPGEIDHFNQPNFEWLSDYQLSPDLTFSSGVYYIKGSGYYDQFRTDRAYWQYAMAPFTLPDGTVVDHTDLVRRRWTDQRQAGFVSRLTWTRGRHTVTFAGDLQRHSDRHHGLVIWGAILPPGTEPDHPYYDYKVEKWSGSASARDAIRIGDRTTALLELQLKGGRYEMKADQFKGVAFKTGFPLLSTRAGIVFAPSKAQRLFFNFATSGREPGFRDIYDPQDPYAAPLFREQHPFRDPLVDPERVYDFEGGWNFTREHLAISANAFWMDFRHEVIFGGQVDDNGNPITGNADRSLHRGIEVAGQANALPHGLYVRANASLNRNVLKKYAEYTYDGPEVLDGNAIAGFPDYLANAAVGFSRGDWSGEVNLFRAGKQYLDNTENERRHPERRAASGYIDKIADPYTLVSFSMQYRLPVHGVDAMLKVHVNNLLDRLYESSGYVEEGVPYWMPAAGRNWFATLEVSF